MNTNNSLLSLLPEHKKNIFFGVIGLTVVDGIMLLVPIIIGDIVTKLSEPNSSEILTSSINKALYFFASSFNTRRSLTHALPPTPGGGALPARAK